LPVLFRSYYYSIISPSHKISQKRNKFPICVNTKRCSSVRKLTHLQSGYT
jgi:hypothetical protein